MDHLKHNSGIILFPKKVAYKKIDDLCAEPIWMVQYICAASRPDSLFNLPFFGKKFWLNCVSDSLQLSVWCSQHRVGHISAHRIV